MVQINGFLLCFGLCLVLSSHSSPAQTSFDNLHEPSLYGRGSLNKNQLTEKQKEKENTEGNSGRHAVATASVVGRAGIKGTFVFTQVGGWAGTVVEMEITGLPSGAEHPYHIHEGKVVNGDCSTTLGHFNPQNVTTKWCDYYAPKHCQVGDLAGKFGNLTGNIAKVRYYDSSLIVSASENGIVGRSVVIHDSAKNKLACGNIFLGRGGETNTSPVDDHTDPCS